MGRISKEYIKHNHHGWPGGLNRRSVLVVGTRRKLTKTHQLTAPCSETQTEGRKIIMANYISIISKYLAVKTTLVAGTF